MICCSTFFYFFESATPSYAHELLWPNSSGAVACVSVTSGVSPRVSSVRIKRAKGRCQSLFVANKCRATAVSDHLSLVNRVCADIVDDRRCSRRRMVFGTFLPRTPCPGGWRRPTPKSRKAFARYCRDRWLTGCLKPQNLVADRAMA